MPTFGEIIKQRRIELEMTQDDLAELCGYKSSTTISRIEMGNRDVPQKQILRIANALRLDPSVLITKQLDKMETEEDRLVCSYIRDDAIRRLVLCAGGILPKEDRDKFIDGFINAAQVLLKRG